jgi:hypothetical protein
MQIFTKITKLIQDSEVRSIFSLFKEKENWWEGCVCFDSVNFLIHGVVAGGTY